MKLGQPRPKVYKLVDGNESELERLTTSPDLDRYLEDVREGTEFVLEEGSAMVKLLPIETPGHLSDHLCFQFEENFGNEKTVSIFTGDHIIGASSTYFTNYPAYFGSLLKTRELIK